MPIPKPLRVFVVHGGLHAAKFLPQPITLVHSVNGADLVLFTGGTDVNPDLYGETAHPRTQMPDIERDEYEMGIFSLAKALGVPMVGICRGAQLLCVLNGGTLVQHQDNSERDHLLFTISGQAFRVTSDHHQAAYPWRIGRNNFELLGWTRQRSSFHLNGLGQQLVMPEDGLECEDVYYPATKSLGIQCHPEWMDENAEAFLYYRNLVIEKFFP